MLVSVNGIDITEHIDEKSYKMNSEDYYESWKDGNNREHRIYTGDKIRGEFLLALYGKDGVDMQEFLDIWNSAVDNHVVTLGVYVQNTNTTEMIEAYYTFTSSFHRKILGGNYFDKIKVSIQEV
jgi:hypothetical protein